MKFLLSFIFIFGALFVLTGASCGRQEALTPPPVTLEFWGTQQREEALRPLIQEYQKTRPYVSVNYRYIDEREYEKKILNALAEDRGPDLFSLPAEKLAGYTNKIVFLPSEVTLPVADDAGIMKNTTVRTLTMKKIKHDYLDFVYNHMVRSYVGADAYGQALPAQDRIVGLPLSADTMVLYYNKDLFTAAKLENPPANWSTFAEYVKSLSKRSEQGKLLQAGAAFGTTQNLPYFFDIISTLMIQNGALMVTRNGAVAFAGIPEGADFEEPPGLNAIQFYVDFASSFKETYTWNDQQPNAMEAFAQGRVAMIFGYANDYHLLKKKAPKLNIGIASMPLVQGNRQAYFGRVNMEVVSQKSANQNVAWDFLTYISDVGRLSAYLDVMKLPTPVRSLIQKQQQDDFLKVYSGQLLNAGNWYKGGDYIGATNAFSRLVSDIHSGRYEYVQDALNFAAESVAEGY